MSPIATIIPKATVWTTSIRVDPLLMVEPHRFQRKYQSDAQYKLDHHTIRCPQQVNVRDHQSGSAYTSVPSQTFRPIKRLRLTTHLAVAASPGLSRGVSAVLSVPAILDPVNNSRPIRFSPIRPIDNRSSCWRPCSKPTLCFSSSHPMAHSPTIPRPTLSTGSWFPTRE